MPTRPTPMPGPIEKPSGQEPGLPPTAPGQPYSPSEQRPAPGREHDKPGDPDHPNNPAQAPDRKIP